MDATRNVKPLSLVYLATTVTYYARHLSIHTALADMLFIFNYRATTNNGLEIGPST